VNDHGTVVGSATNASFQTFAFIWDERAGMRKLLDAPSGAIAINNRGDIIGNLAFPASFLLSDGVLTRLDTLPALQMAGFTQFTPEEINDRGWIVGSAFGPTRGGRAVLLIPKGS
jgi:probable HAF family extracellular repeat protein